MKRSAVAEKRRFNKRAATTITGRAFTRPSWGGSAVGIQVFTEAVMRTSIGT